VFRARAQHDDDWKTMGETLVVKPGEKVIVEMEMTVPTQNNSPTASTTRCSRRSASSNRSTSRRWTIST